MNMDLFTTSTCMAAVQPQDQTTPAVVMFTCDHPGCDRAFNRKYTLAEHAMTHTGEKPHVCPVKTCGKSFSTSGNLSRHKRLHGYIEPLACPVQGCICSFPSNNKLAKHMKFHFASEDVKVCVVAGCGKTFSTTGNLNRHMKAMHDNDDVYGKSECSSPVSSSGAFPSHTRSPTSTNQWAAADASIDVDLEALWMCAPIAFTEPECEESFWDLDLEDALAVLFDESEAFQLVADLEIPDLDFESAACDRLNSCVCVSK